MGVLRVKDGVRFDRIAPAGFRILAAFDQAAAKFCDLWITSGTDGEHSGPEDPHHKGEAYDVRSQTLDANTKSAVLTFVMSILGWDRFYGFLEAPGTSNEHFHVQRKKGTVYP